MYISLKIKIWLFFNLTILLIVVFSYFYFPSHQSDFLVENESHEVQYITTSLAANINVALEEENFKAIYSIMEEIRNDSRLEYVAIFQHDSIRAPSDKWEVTKTLFQIYPEDTDVNQNLESQEGLIVKSALFTSPILNGEIIVGFQTDNILTIVDNLRRTILISGTIVFLIGSIISYVISNTITRSLQRLKEGAKSIGSGNLNFKTQIKNNDELGKLSQAFEQMTRDLAISRDSINYQNKELEVANRELIELNEEKNNIIGIVAHDLKNPLSSIDGLLKLIKIEARNNKQIELIEHASRSSQKMDELIMKILESQAIERSGLIPDIQAISILPILNGVINDYSVKASDKKIKIITEYNIDQSRQIKLDSKFTFQVFDNLLSNSIKFSPENKNITIRVFEKNNQMVVEIQDEGPGINKDDREKLYQKYQKLSAIPTAGESSTGLGLSIVKKLVELMNAGIIFDAPEIGGAKFIVTFSN